MKLGMQVGLDPGHIVLDADPAPHPPKGHIHPIFGPYLLWPNGWMDTSSVESDKTWDNPKCTTKQNALYSLMISQKAKFFWNCTNHRPIPGVQCIVLLSASQASNMFLSPVALSTTKLGVLDDGVCHEPVSFWAEQSSDLCDNLVRALRTVVALKHVRST